MSHAPYREPTAETGTRLRVFPGLSAPIIGLMVVISCAPLLLHLFLWSRVVEIRCERVGTHVACDVDENAIGTGQSSRVEVDHPDHARIEGAITTTRGDAWIEVVGATRARLTRGFNLAKDEQRKTAAGLTAFFKTTAPTFSASFGSRWATLPVPALGFSAALAFYFLFGLRVTLERRERQGTLAIELRRWPLPGRHLGFDLRDVRGVELGGDPTSRVYAYKHGANVCLRLVSGELVRLALTTGRGVEALQKRLDAFVKPSKAQDD